MDEKVPNTPRTEFFDGSISTGNQNVPLVVQVSPSGQLIHVLLLKDEREAISSSERRIGIGAQEYGSLMGRVLTLCDAAFADREQRKGFKDSMRQVLREWITEQENSAMASAGISGWVGRPFNETGEVPERDRISLMP